MAQKLEQTQTQTQIQQLAMQQVALAGLVELPIADLADRVRNEMVENAALEETDHDNAEETTESADNDDAANEAEDGEEWDAADSGEIRDSLGDYMNEDEVPTYLQARADDARERHEIPLAGGTSAYDDLVRQIGEHDLNEHEREVLEYLIGSLDEDGFLRKDVSALADELAIYHNVPADDAEVERLLRVLQTFDPRGIGARDLQECLRLQLEDPDFPSAYKAQALDVVKRSFKDFVAKRWDIIAQRHGFDDDTTAHVRHVLTHLNPRPGSLLGSGTAENAPTIIPDFYVHVDDDELPEIELNNGDVPDLHVSRAFRDTISQYLKQGKKPNREQHDAFVYAKQKVESAKTFIDLLARRRRTLLAVMQAIVDVQRDFFCNEDDENMLHPLQLKDVAARAGVDISTVSRVTGSKYVQTDYGTYPLKFFFSLQFTSETGDELSARKVRTAIREIVDGEDKSHPLSDEAITAALRGRQLVVARRTVAKYREQLGILTARLRKA